MKRFVLSAFLMLSVAANSASASTATATVTAEATTVVTRVVSQAQFATANMAASTQAALVAAYSRSGNNVSSTLKLINSKLGKALSAQEKKDLAVILQAIKVTVEQDGAVHYLLTSSTDNAISEGFISGLRQLISKGIEKARSEKINLGKALTQIIAESNGVNEDQAQQLVVGACGA